MIEKKKKRKKGVITLVLRDYYDSYYIIYTSSSSYALINSVCSRVRVELLGLLDLPGLLLFDRWLLGLFSLELDEVTAVVSALFEVELLGLLGLFVDEEALLLLLLLFEFVFEFEDVRDGLLELLGLFDVL